MSGIWIPITVAAAMIQTARSFGQRRLLGRVSGAAAAYCRFFYGLPFAALILLLAAMAEGRWPPTPSAAFLAYGALGAITQVIGNALFIALIRSSNFAVMTTYAKMETVLSPVFSFFLLGDHLRPAGTAGVVIALAGVILLAAARAERGLRAFLTASLRRPASLGILVGALYAVSSTAYRAAALDLEGVGFALRAATLLAWVALVQVLVMGGYFLVRSPFVMTEVLRAWRSLWWIGATGMGASACWLAAFALQKTGYVLALGQIELIFSYAVSHVLLKERAHPLEIAGILTTIGGIVMVVLPGS